MPRNILMIHILMKLTWPMNAPTRTTKSTVPKKNTGPAKKIRSKVKWKNGEAILDKTCYDDEGNIKKIGLANIDCD